MKKSKSLPIGTLCRVTEGTINQYLSGDMDSEDFVGELSTADFVIFIEQKGVFVECVSKHGNGFVFAGTIEKDQ